MNAKRLHADFLLTGETKIRETKDTVRVSLQQYLFTGSSKVTSCGFRQKRVRLWELLEGGLRALQEPTLTCKPPDTLQSPETGNPENAIFESKKWTFGGLDLDPLKQPSGDI